MRTIATMIEIYTATIQAFESRSFFFMDSSQGNMDASHKLIVSFDDEENHISGRSYTILTRDMMKKGYVAIFKMMCSIIEVARTMLYTLVDDLRARHEKCIQWTNCMEQVIAEMDNTREDMLEVIQTTGTVEGKDMLANFTMRFTAFAKDDSDTGAIRDKDKITELWKRRKLELGPLETNDDNAHSSFSTRPLLASRYALARGV